MNFTAPSLKSIKLFSIVETILEKADRLYQPIVGGTRYISSMNREIPYEKLVVGNFIIIYREEKNNLYVIRVFDTRQNPEKLNY